MDARAFVGNYWRVLLLLVFVAVSLTALFVPGAAIGGGQADLGGNSTDDGASSPTNLVFGLGLDGGTRISAPLVGMHVPNVDVDPAEADALQRDLRDELGVENADVKTRVDPDDGTVSAEVFTKDVTAEEFAAALRAAGVDGVSASDVRTGVTPETRAENVDVIQRKINEAGLSGGRVTQATALGETFIVVEAPAQSPSELQSILEQRGVVEVVAYYPNEEGQQVNETVLEQGDFQDVDPPAFNNENGHHVPVSVTRDAAPEFQQKMNEYGFTGEGVGSCAVEVAESGTVNYRSDVRSWCLLTVVDGEVVDAHSMGDLALNMRDGTWVNRPTFIMATPTHQDAQTLSISLRAGSLVAPLDFDRDQSFTIEPALAERFKTYSLFIGVLAVLTVSATVYLRYADGRVAVPMVVTALSEVVILLGFAAAIAMPLELAHIAGLIAVIGTGVDDLVIIADEVMSQGDVNSKRVFQSRFRKAFWVIGAAAATTIIAMSPLAILSLGDLRGFAIVTILGVLAGVLVTRPAYGDILRILMTDR